jgi:hypothetical protein
MLLSADNKSQLTNYWSTFGLGICWTPGYGNFSYFDFGKHNHIPLKKYNSVHSNHYLNNTIPNCYKLHQAATAAFLFSLHSK